MAAVIRRSSSKPYIKIIFVHQTAKHGGISNNWKSKFLPKISKIRPNYCILRQGTKMTSLHLSSPIYVFRVQHDITEKI